MCGILAILENSIHDTELDLLTHFIDRRGPDFKSGIVHHKASCGKELSFYASILQLRGQIIQKQPVIDESKNVLLFNGQIYRFGGLNLSSDDSDTRFLMMKLGECKSQLEVVQHLKMIDGPFAVIYWNDSMNTLFYGRDIFGRKSLCKLSDPSSNDLLISSVAIQGLEGRGLSWSEIHSDGFLAIEFDGIYKKTTTKFEWNYDIIYPPTSKCKHNMINSSIGVVKMTCDQICKLNYDSCSPGSFNEQKKLQSVDLMELKLMEAVRSRIIYNKPDCLNCRKLNKPLTEVCTHAKYAVAFSGGLDSTVLALALHKIIDKNESIDLLSCAFKPQSPDRESVGSAFNELIEISPDRLWRLVISDIELPELETKRNDVIRHLIWPCKTVIDDSLGCASWFIGRGQGRSLISSIAKDRNDLISEFLDWNPDGKSSNRLENCGGFNSNYTSPSSMIFTGSSIDEQLGGYSSHRSAWSNSGSVGLNDEISFQMRRLPTRNLGRDDRIYSDHGRDIKLPYLDFELVSFLNQLPVGLKMDMDLDSDIGAKMILRHLAIRWGLKITGRRVKRAMQFGTKIAKIENSKERGDDICSRLIKLNNNT